MGFNLNKAEEAREKLLNSFTPCELNEGNVQVIFNRCLATENSKETSYIHLNIKEFGYERDDIGVSLLCV